MGDRRRRNGLNYAVESRQRQALLIKNGNFDLAGNQLCRLLYRSNDREPGGLSPHGYFSPIFFKFPTITVISRSGCKYCLATR
jgi:hypothetical protein